MTYENLEQAVAELRKHPAKTVKARCGDFAVELRAISPPAVAGRLGDSLVALGPWEGETTEELMSRLRQAREAGGSAEPPPL
jgi:hypothetical protein